MKISNQIFKSIFPDLSNSGSLRSFWPKDSLIYSLARKKLETINKYFWIFGGKTKPINKYFWMFPHSLEERQNPNFWQPGVREAGVDKGGGDRAG